MGKASQNKSAKQLDKIGLADRLKYLRGRRQLSQEGLAKLSGISQSTIAQIESGRKDPSISTLRKISGALDVEMAILFAGDDVHVFDMNRLRKRYKSPSDLNDTLYKALGEVVRFAKEIKFV